MFILNILRFEMFHVFQMNPCLSINLDTFYLFICNLICLFMGEEGKRVRVRVPVWRSEYTFWNLVFSF